VGGDRAASPRRGRLDRPAEDRQHGRHLPGGVGVHEAPHDRAPVPDHRMRDVPQRPPQQRLDRGGLRGALHPGVPGEGADPHAPVARVDGVELRHAVDVDEGGRGGEPHVQQRDEALPPGEHLARRCGGEDVEGLVERARGVVAERGWFHEPRLRLRPAPGSSRPAPPGPPGPSPSAPSACSVRRTGPPTSSRAGAMIAAPLPVGPRRALRTWYPTRTAMVPNAMPWSGKSSVIFSVTSPIARMRPAAAGTRLTGSAKSSRYSSPILARSRPFMPYSTRVMPPRTPPGVAAISAPNLGHSPNRIATIAAT